MKSSWTRKNIGAFFRLKWLQLAEAAGKCDRAAFLDEQSQIGLLSGLMLIVAISGMIVDENLASCSAKPEWLGECKVPTWIPVANTFCWGSATSTLVMATIAAVILGLAGAETKSEAEFHHLRALLGQSARLPAFLLMVGTISLILGIVSYHCLIFGAHWKILLGCGGGLGVGVLALPVVLHTSLKACWALHVVYGTTPVAAQKKAQSKITVQDIYDDLVEYSKERDNQLARIDKCEFMKPYQSVLSPPMLELAEKIWNTWIERHEKSILDELFASQKVPVETEIGSTGIHTKSAKVTFEGDMFDGR